VNSGLKQRCSRPKGGLKLQRHGGHAKKEREQREEFQGTTAVDRAKKQDKVSVAEHQGRRKTQSWKGGGEKRRER